LLAQRIGNRHGQTPRAGDAHGALCDEDTTLPGPGSGTGA
jgi:hypothetical protein